MNGEENKLSYLALGDSYTIGESVEADEKWPVQLVRQLRQHGINISNPKIIAKTGWRTDDLIKAIKEAEPAKNFDLVSLLIGVNNQYQNRPLANYEKDFEKLLKKAISLTKKNKPERVFVLSIPDYGFTPFGESKKDTISVELDNYNAINKKISSQYGVWYLDITDISRKGLENPELVAEDKLHPSAEQHRLWVERILQNEKFISFLQGLQ